MNTQTEQVTVEPTNQPDQTDVECADRLIEVGTQQSEDTGPGEVQPPANDELRASSAQVYLPPRADAGAPKVRNGDEWGAVEPWPTPVDGQALLNELVGVFRRYVVVPQWGQQALALWTLHTYAYQLREVSTYIGVESPEKRCGKTTLLGVLAQMVSRPVVAANISPPAFFRVIEEAHPTLLIDEADTFLQGNDELRGILNSGYNRQTAYVLRVAGDPAQAEARLSRARQLNPAQADQEAGLEASGVPAGKGARSSQLARFSCWCPKVLAAIGALPETLKDRCIVIRMQRKLPQEPCERLRNLHATDLRRRCLRFVLDHQAEIATAQPLLPDELNDRAADIWEPLLALADLAGGTWPAASRQAAVGLSAGTQDNNAIGWLFWDLFCAFHRAKKDRIFSRDLVAWLNHRGDRPWADLLKGRAVTELWLSHRLRPYGVRPKTIWEDNISARGYAKDDFGDLFWRYVPRNEVLASRAESKPTAPKESPVAAANC